MRLRTQLRFGGNKDTGVVHFDDGASASPPIFQEPVELGPGGSPIITRRIAAMATTRPEYVDISYRSRKPSSTRGRVAQSAFALAPSTGKPGFRPLCFRVIAMKTKPTLLELLRKQPEMYLRDLPENIRIPGTGRQSSRRSRASHRRRHHR